jgi:hypothetical protein
MLNLTSFYVQRRNCYDFEKEKDIKFIIFVHPVCMNKPISVILYNRYKGIPRKK